MNFERNFERKKREKKENPLFAIQSQKPCFQPSKSFQNLSNTKVNTLFFIWGHPLVEVEWIVPPQSRSEVENFLVWKPDLVPGAWHKVFWPKIKSLPQARRLAGGRDFQFPVFLFSVRTFLFMVSMFWKKDITLGSKQWFWGISNNFLKFSKSLVHFFKLKTFDFSR